MTEWKFWNKCSSDFSLKTINIQVWHCTQDVWKVRKLELCLGRAAVNMGGVGVLT